MNQIPSLEAAVSHTWSVNLPPHIDPRVTTFSTARQCTAPSARWIQSMSTALFSCTLRLPLFRSPRSPLIYLLLPPSYVKLLSSEFDVSWTVHHCDTWRTKNQLDATYYFIVLLIGSTCFRHHYAHHQELKTVMLITTLVVSFLVCFRLEPKLQPAARTLLQPNRT